MDIIQSVIGLLPDGLKSLRRWYREDLTQLAVYERLSKIRTGLSRSFIEDALDSVPALTKNLTIEGYDEVVYRNDSCVLQAIFNNTSHLAQFCITALDVDFKMPFEVAGAESRLGETVYGDWDAAVTRYAEISSKDCRYGESIYLGNPGDYQHLLLSTHIPPGVTRNREATQRLVSCVHELWQSDWKPGRPIPADLRTDLGRARDLVRPNTFGFLSDERLFSTVRFGSVYAENRPVL